MAEFIGVFNIALMFDNLGLEYRTIYNISQAQTLFQNIGKCWEAEIF